MTLTGHSETVNSVSVSPDGRLVVSGSADTTAKVWLRNGDMVQNLNASANITSVAFSTCGKFIAAGSADGSLALFRRARGTGAAAGLARQTSVEAQRQGLSAFVLVSEDDAADCDREQRGPAVLSLCARPQTAVSGQKYVLASCDNEGRLVVWPGTGDGGATGVGGLLGAPRTFVQDNERVAVAQCSPCGRYLASGKTKLVVYRFQPFRVMFELREGDAYGLEEAMSGPGDPIAALAYSADGLLLAVSRSTSIRVWTLAGERHNKSSFNISRQNSSEPKRLPRGGRQRQRGYSRASSGSSAVSGGARHGAHPSPSPSFNEGDEAAGIIEGDDVFESDRFQRNLGDGGLDDSSDSEAEEGAAIAGEGGVGVSPADAVGAGMLRLKREGSGASSTSSISGKTAVDALAFSPRGAHGGEPRHLLAGAGSMGHVHVWLMGGNGRGAPNELAVVGCEMATLHCLAFVQCGSGLQLVVGGSSGVRWLEVDETAYSGNMSAIRLLPVPDDVDAVEPVKHLALTATGQVLATAGVDICLWHAKSMMRLAVLGTGLATISALTFGGEQGNWLFAADDRGCLCVWREDRAGDGARESEGGGAAPVQYPVMRLPVKSDRVKADIGRFVTSKILRPFRSWFD